MNVLATGCKSKSFLKQHRQFTKKKIILHVKNNHENFKMNQTKFLLLRKSPVSSNYHSPKLQLNYVRSTTYTYLVKNITGTTIIIYFQTCKELQMHYDYFLRQ